MLKELKVRSKYIIMMIHFNKMSLGKTNFTENYSSTLTCIQTMKYLYDYMKNYIDGYSVYPGAP